LLSIKSVLKYRMKTKYPIWQYPIICLGLLIFLKRHRFKINTIIAHRKSIGITDFRLCRIIEFGHWLVSEEINAIWWG